MGGTVNCDHCTSFNVSGVNDRRIGRQFGGRTGLAVAGDRAVDQRRIERAQRFVIELQAAHHAGPKILDKYV